MRWTCDAVLTLRVGCGRVIAMKRAFGFYAGFSAVTTLFFLAGGLSSAALTDYSLEGHGSLGSRLCDRLMCRVPGVAPNIREDVKAMKNRSVGLDLRGRLVAYANSNSNFNTLQRPDLQFLVDEIGKAKQSKWSRFFDLSLRVVPLPIQFVHTSAHGDALVKRFIEKHRAALTSKVLRNIITKMMTVKARDACILDVLRDSAAAMSPDEHGRWMNALSWPDVADQAVGTILEVKPDMDASDLNSLLQFTSTNQAARLAFEYVQRGAADLSVDDFVEILEQTSFSSISGGERSLFQVFLSERATDLKDFEVDKLLDYSTPDTEELIMMSVFEARGDNFTFESAIHFIQRVGTYDTSEKLANAYLDRFESRLKVPQLEELSYLVSIAVSDRIREIISNR